MTKPATTPYELGRIQYKEQVENLEKVHKFDNMVRRYVDTNYHTYSQELYNRILFKDCETKYECTDVEMKTTLSQCQLKRKLTKEIVNSLETGKVKCMVMNDGEADVYKGYLKDVHSTDITTGEPISQYHFNNEFIDHTYKQASHISLPDGVRCKMEYGKKYYDNEIMTTHLNVISVHCNRNYFSRISRWLSGKD
jgi:hypothetical protein